MDGWTGGRVDGCMGGWVDGWMAARVAGWMDGWVDGWSGGRVDGCMGGWVGGWMDGCMQKRNVCMGLSSSRMEMGMVKSEQYISERGEDYIGDEKEENQAWRPN